MKRPYTRPRRTVRDPYARLYNALKVLEYLQTAESCAQYAGLGFTLPRIAVAISSARGAVRNAQGRVNRVQRVG